MSPAVQKKIQDANETMDEARRRKLREFWQSLPMSEQKRLLMAFDQGLFKPKPNRATYASAPISSCSLSGLTLPRPNCLANASTSAACI